MADQFKEVTTTGYGSRIMNSIKGIVIGFILFMGSFGLLYWNEGRVDMSTIAKTSVELSADTVSTDSSLSNKLVSVTGNFTTEDQFGDVITAPTGSITLNDGKYIALKRNVEMFSWVEESSSKSSSNTGGSETTETTYSYNQQWTTDPKSSSEFKQPQGHVNPALPFTATDYHAFNAKVGAYNVDVANVELPTFSPVKLTDSMVTLPAGIKLADSTYIFVGAGSLSSPQVGDVRVSYTAVPSDVRSTIFGSLDGEYISKYVDTNGNELYRVLAGSKSEALAAMHGEYTMMLWILRAVGFVLMWIGLSMLFAPISVLFDVLPILGSLSKGLIGFVTGLVAFILSIVTILVSMILHSVVAVVIALVAAVVAIVLVVTVLKKKNVAPAHA